ncbi:hypothetical protein K466DRAFT_61861 [Polyporus arcularius HHB13444]|uniref:Uncharacterized protein n=1 Tax=Polyporus arcularius HHB13444 TaxID=1314778 RepID=A0A5C3NPU0_9APHY|nr:hypothetical protein K466DRAFT_61861 [Polyporus arcularius HHB13444]
MGPRLPVSQVRVFLYDVHTPLGPGILVPSDSLLSANGRRPRPILRVATAGRSFDSECSRRSGTQLPVHRNRRLCELGGGDAEGTCTKLGRRTVMKARGCGRR